MKKSRLLSAVLLLTSLPALAGENDDQALFDRGMASFHRSLYVEALGDFTELASRSPASPLAERSRALILEIGDRLRRMEDRWNATDNKRRAESGGGDAASLALRKAKALSALNRLVGRVGDKPERLLRNIGGGALAGDKAQTVEALQLEARLYELRTRLGGPGWAPETLLEAEGFAALEEGDLRGCVEAWTTVLTSGSGDELLEAFLQRASARWEADREDSYFREAMAAGKSAALKGDAVAARTAFSRALLLKPDDAEAGRLMKEAEAQARRGDASEAFRRKMADAEALSKKGDTLRAIPLLVEALELSPGHPGALKLLSSIKDRLPQRSASPKAPAAPPSAPPRRSADRTAAEEAYTLGMMHYVRGEPAKALAFFEKANSLDPSFEEAAQALASVRRERRAP